MDISNLPPELLTPIVIGLVFAALASIAGFALMALSIWEKLRRKPSVDVTLAGHATKLELHSAEERLSNRIVIVDRRITHELEKLHEERKKTDGQLFDLIRQQNKDLRDQIEASQVGTNRELNSVAKEVGRLIGVVEALQKGGN